MKEISLTKGLVAFVDDEDFERVSQHKWSAYFPSKEGPPYAKRTIKKNRKCRCISLHRFIMDATPGLKVDHIDGNGLNNQKSNLRFYEKGQNHMNMKCHSRHGLKGLCFTRGRNKNPWMGTIVLNGESLYLGRFPSKIDAAIAYNIAAIKHFGEFARLNPIPFTYESTAK